MRPRSDRAEPELKLIKKAVKGVGRATAAIAKRGDKAFRGAVRKIAKDPVVRSALRAGTKVVKKTNLLRAARMVAEAGAKNLRESVRFAAMVAPFVPGIGTGVAAALGAVDALASGKPITDAVIAAARNAIPGGAVAHAAFDFAAGLARGKGLSKAALEAARARLPGGRAAQAAFDAGLALARGKSVQDAAFAAAGRALPPSPYAANGVAFARAVASGSKITDAALSTAGKQLMRKLERRGVDIVAVAHGRVPAPRKPAARGRK